MKVLVTGAAGRVGTAVCRELAGRHYVRGLDLVPCAADEVLVGDLLDAETRARALAGMEGVIHLAFCGRTRDVAGSYAINAQGTYQLLEAAQALGVSRFVYASTLSVYSGAQWQEWATRGMMSEEVPPLPGEIYGLTKYLGEEACRMFGRNGLRCTILRLTGVTLPDHWEQVVASRSGSSTHVADVALSFRLALENDPPPAVVPVYHICGDHPNKPTPIERARAALGFHPAYNLA